MTRLRFSPGPFVALALTVTATTAARAQAVPSLPFRQGDVSFAVTVDNGPDFVGHVAVASAAFTGTSLDSVRGFAEVQVAAMRTGMGLRDQHLRNVMDADSLPAIRFELDEVRVGHVHGDTTDVALHGFLVLHGQRRAVRAEGLVVRTGTAIEAVASFPVDMREYHITPPVRFIGAIRVRPLTRIRVTLRFGGPTPTGPPPGM